MGIEKVYTCDLCGLVTSKDDSRRVGYRTWADRPDPGAVDWLVVGDCCTTRPVSDFLAAAIKIRDEVENGTPAPA